jgi:hypothetical protein
MFRTRLVRVPAVEVAYNLLCILEPGGGELRGFVIPNPFNSIFEVWPFVTASSVPAGIYYLFYLLFLDAVHFNERRKILMLFRQRIGKSRAWQVNVKDRMYFHKRGQFQAVGIRANNLGYWPKPKIFSIELFLGAGGFNIFRI